MNRTNAGKGLKRTLAFYLLGFLLTIVVHVFYGFGSPKTPPGGYFVLLFFTVVGICWFMVDLFLIFVKKKATTAKVNLLVHTVGLLVFSILISLLWIWGAGANS